MCASKHPSEFSATNSMDHLSDITSGEQQRLMKINKTTALAAVSTLTLCALALDSCDTYAGQGAGYGAAAGAIIGGATTGRVRGAAVGAAIGAASGAIIGAAISEEEARRYGPAPAGGYPVA